MIALIALVLLALLACGLVRKRRRRPYRWPPPAGSSDVQDRDAERLRAELRSAADRAEMRP